MDGWDGGERENQGGQERDNQDELEREIKAQEIHYSSSKNSVICYILYTIFYNIVNYNIYAEVTLLQHHTGSAQGGFDVIPHSIGGACGTCAGGPLGNYPQ